jgi:hypothetical protein
MVRKSFEPSKTEREIGGSLLESSSLCEDYGNEKVGKIFREGKI